MLSSHQEKPSTSSLHGSKASSMCDRLAAIRLSWASSPSPLMAKPLHWFSPMPLDTYIPAARTSRLYTRASCQACCRAELRIQWSPFCSTRCRKTLLKPWIYGLLRHLTLIIILRAFSDNLWFPKFTGYVTISLMSYIGDSCPGKLPQWKLWHKCPYTNAIALFKEIVTFWCRGVNYSFLGIPVDLGFSSHTQAIQSSHPIEDTLLMSK